MQIDRISKVSKTAAELQQNCLVTSSDRISKVLTWRFHNLSRRCDLGSNWKHNPLLCHTFQISSTKGQTPSQCFRNFDNVVFDILGSNFKLCRGSMTGKSVLNRYPMIAMVATAVGTIKCNSEDHHILFNSSTFSLIFQVWLLPLHLIAEVNCWRGVASWIAAKGLWY